MSCQISLKHDSELAALSLFSGMSLFGCGSNNELEPITTELTLKPSTASEEIVRPRSATVVIKRQDGGEIGV